MKQKGRNIHHENKNKNNPRKNNQPKMKATWVKKGMLGKFVSKKNKQTLGNEKARKTKIKETPKIMFSKQKGLMDKRQREMEFRKGRQKTSLSGEQNRKHL